MVEEAKRAKDKVFPINGDWIEQVELFLEEIREHNVNQAVVCYRRKDGDLCYKVFSNQLFGEQAIGLVGMLHQVSHRLLHDEDQFLEWREEE
jgi:hypothetical protein